MSLMKKEALFAFWKRYVDSRNLYRIVSEEYLPAIRRAGLNPKKDPFENHKKDIFRLFDICLKLHKSGFIMVRWWGKPVDQVKVINVTRHDLNNDFIDFTPDSGNLLEYYLKLPGGALVNTLFIFTEELLLKQPPLTQSDYALIRKLNAWSKKKRAFKNRILSVRGSSSYFESAHFQYPGGHYELSPFGSFEHFKKVVSKRGLAFYAPYLTGKTRFYLRLRKAIPASQIRYETKRNRK